MGVTGVTGVPAFTPLTLESHFLVDGVMAMRARERRWEMERRRLCGDCFIMGDAALVVAFS